MVKSKVLLRYVIHCVGVWVICAWAIPAQAQQEQLPLRLTVINASERGGEQPRAMLMDILYGNESLEVIESEDIRRVMEDFGVNEKILRKQSLRKKFRNRLMRLHAARRIEGMLIVDTYNKGRTVQVVVLGPEGGEIQDIRRTIKRGKLEKDDAIDILQEVFPVLGPEVLTFRERQLLAKQDEDPSKTPPQGNPDENVDPDDKKEDEKKEPDTLDDDGYFSRGIDIGAGYYFGDRLLQLEEVDNNSPDYLNHGTPMHGVGIQLDATALTFGEQNSASLALRGSFAIGFFRTTNQVTNREGNPSVAKYPSDSIDIVGELIFRKMLGSRFHLGVFGGVQNMVVSISQTSLPDDETQEVYNNSRYTGTGYLAGRAGLEAGYRFTESIHASINAGALPLFYADVSQALGENETTVGAFGGGRLKLNFTDTVFVQTVYLFSFFRPVFPNPPGMAAGGEVKIDSRAEGTDIVHNVQAIVGLSF